MIENGRKRKDLKDKDNDTPISPIMPLPTHI